MLEEISKVSQRESESKREREKSESKRERERSESSSHNTNLNFSCPAVSHSCNLIRIPSLISMVLAKKSTPTVGSQVSVKLPSVNTLNSVDLPTVLSPIRISLN